MSKVTRAYPLLVWGVALGLLPSCKVGGTHQPGIGCWYAVVKSCCGYTSGTPDKNV